MITAVVVASALAVALAVTAWLDEREYAPPRGKGPHISTTHTVTAAANGSYLVECECGDLSVVHASDLKSLAKALAASGHTCP